MNDSGPISREKTAELLVGTNAPVDESIILDIYERMRLRPPDNFVISPFDRLVLARFVNFPGNVTSNDILDDLKFAFAVLDYPSAGNDANISDINNYLDALRGVRIPGITRRQTTEIGYRNNSIFPEIRDRYNVANMLKSSRKNEITLPQIKTDIQYKVANMILVNLSYTDIDEILKAPRGTVGRVVDMMALDLYDIDPELLKQSRFDGVNAYQQVVSESSVIDNYLAGVERGELLGNETYPLSNYLAYDLVTKWKDLYTKNAFDNKYDLIFDALNLKYTQQAARQFIMGGSGTVNGWISEGGSYGKLKVHAQLGSFIVHITFGLDYTTFSPFDMLD